MRRRYRPVFLLISLLCLTPCGWGQVFENVRYEEGLSALPAGPLKGQLILEEGALRFSANNAEAQLPYGAIRQYWLTQSGSRPRMLGIGWGGGSPVLLIVSLGVTVLQNVVSSLAPLEKTECLVEYADAGMRRVARFRLPSADTRFTLTQALQNRLRPTEPYYEELPAVVTSPPMEVPAEPLPDLSATPAPTRISHPAP